MNESAFYRLFGISLIPRFLDPRTCARLRAQMSAAAQASAKVLKRGRGYVLDQAARRTRLAAIRPESASALQARLQELRPRLERYFRLRLRGSEEPQFLLYRRGSYFEPHSDRADYGGYAASRRRVSVVLFLSRESRKPSSGAYCGGELTFYGLVRGPAIGRFGFTIQGKPGLLVAFRSDVAHEVTPVTHGKRCTVVTWYY